MKGISAIWDDIGRRSSRVRQQRLQPLKAFLENLDNAHARLLSGRPDVDRPSTESAHELEVAFVDQYARGRLTISETADWLGLTYAAIKEFKRQGADIPVTRLSDYQPPEVSPFAPDTLTTAVKLTRWRDALHIWIRNRLSLAPRAEVEAAISLSAVIHGALADRTRMTTLLALLSKEQPFEIQNGYVVVTFRLPFRSLGFRHVQRWFADPISAMLMIRLSSHEGPSLQYQGLLGAIRNILIKGGIAEEDFPASISEIVKGSFCWWGAQGCSVDIRISQRKVVAHGFDDATWQALTRDRSEVSASEETQDDARTSLSADEGTTQTDENADSGRDDLLAIHPWYADVEQALSHEDLDSARRYCAGLLDTHPEGCAKTYLSCLNDLLNGKSSAKNPLQLSTIRRRFGITLFHLLNQLGETDPSILSREELTDIYGEILLEADPRDQVQHLGPGLRDFHYVLADRFGISKISSDDPIFGAAALKPVSASVITVEEYLAAISWIDRQSGRHWSQHDKTICKLVLMLCFRCGFRRMEAFGSRLEDFHCHLRMFALIRKNVLRGLKTKNSERVVPLFALLTRAERRELLNWLKHRGGNSSVSQGFLFEEFGKNGGVSWADRLSRRIIAALHAVTGRDVYMHHLRHSFATWLNLQLRGSDYPLVHDFFAHLPKTAALIRRGHWVRRLLISANTGVAPHREYSYCLGRLLGHSSPAISLGHYIHSADMLIGGAVWRAAADLPRTVMAAVSGLKESAAYARLDKGIPNLVQGCVSKYCRRAKPVCAPLRSTQSDITSPSSDGWISFKRIEAVLALSMNPKLTTRDIALDQSIDEDRGELMLEIAADWAPMFRIKLGGNRITRMPKLPRGADETAYFEKLERHLLGLYESDRDLLIEGINIHACHYNEQKRDVLFQGSKHLDALRNYLKFLKKLGLEEDAFLWVLRQRLRGEPHLPAWVSRLRLRWWPPTLKVIAPPASQYEREHAMWVGLLPVDADGDGMGKLFSTAVYFCMMNLGQRDGI